MYFFQKNAWIVKPKTKPLQQLGVNSEYRLKLRLESWAPECQLYEKWKLDFEENKICKQCFLIYYKVTTCAYIFCDEASKIR